MLTLKYIAVHHFGGTESNSFASTKDLSLDAINRAHRSRWPDFPSQYITFGTEPSFIGYNIIIFPEGTFVQGRSVGEETAAVRGYNDQTLSICLAGNFNKIRVGTIPVDPPTQAQKDTLLKIMKAALSDKLTSLGIHVLYGTVLKFSLADIHAHRHFSQTECFGSALPDTWARSLLVDDIYSQLAIIKTLVQKLMAMRDYVLKQNQSLGSMLDRECDGIIN